jgi:hypothetical protein
MQIPQAKIGIEDNKPVAIELLNNALLKSRIHFEKPASKSVPLKTSIRKALRNADLRADKAQSTAGSSHDVKHWFSTSHREIHLQILETGCAHRRRSHSTGALADVQCQCSMAH